MQQRVCLQHCIFHCAALVCKQWKELCGVELLCVCALEACGLPCKQLDGSRGVGWRPVTTKAQITCHIAYQRAPLGCRCLEEKRQLHNTAECWFYIVFGVAWQRICPMQCMQAFPRSPSRSYVQQDASGCFMKQIQKSERMRTLWHKLGHKASTMNAGFRACGGFIAGVGLNASRRYTTQTRKIISTANR